MKLIDKAALVAEIDRRIKETKSMQPKFDQFWAGQISAFKGVLKILDTLEVKEVDLEKENLIGTLEREVKIDAGGYPYINCDIEFYDYDKDVPLAKKGDKVKIVVIKGE